ncbi:TadE/TadG family type IV pilus assembly protein [Halostreptopolyspora alba]|uniref:Pilus assembly protein n=1 Tax=Halostreptopolyspora alba TaxID=2487137 RepID=A0A3N0E6N1_9ACTN|nr:pilus assembly protein [Nocardiopsaceae bacterium YIM 96095]
MSRFPFASRIGALRLWTAPRTRTDHGSQFVEFAIYLPAFMLFVVICFEAFMGFSALERMENAARASADAAGRYGADHGRDIAAETLPDWLERQADIRVSRVDHGYSTRITVSFPLLYPYSGLDLPVSRTVNMPT